MPAEKPASNQDVENLGKSISSGLSGISKILNKNKEQEKSNTETVLDSLKGIGALLSENKDLLKNSNTKDVVDSLKGINTLLTGNKALEVENKREKGRADQRFLEALKNLGGIFKTSGGAGGDKPGFLSGLKIPKLLGLSALLGFFSKLAGILLKAPFKMLGLVFSGLGSMFLFLGAGAILTYWALTSEEDRKKHLENFKTVMTNIGDWFKRVYEAFTITWAEELKSTDTESLPAKWREFTKAWGKAGDTIANAFSKFEIGAIPWGGSLGTKGPYTGAGGIGNFLADMTISIAGIFLDVGTAIAKFIVDPAQYMGKFNALITNAFDDMGQNISTAFADLFSLDTLIKSLPDWMVPDSLRQKAFRQREARMYVEVEKRQAESELAQKEIDKLEKFGISQIYINFSSQLLFISKCIPHTFL